MGIALPMPLLPLAQDAAVTIVLENSAGACWRADYAAPATRNDPTSFRDKSD